jgi:hypothetical protein
MRKLILIASAAAMAASMPALAEKGGKGGGGGGKPVAAQGGGNGGGNPHKAHGGGHAGGNPHKMAGGGHAKPAKAERAHGGGKAMKAEKSRDQAMRGGGKAMKAERHAVRDRIRREERIVRQRTDDRSGGFDSIDRRFAGSSQGSCPPGLAAKNNGCLPPGQAKKMGLGDRVQMDRFGSYNVPQQYSAFYQDSPAYYYRYGEDGYIYRIDRSSNLISGLVPLLGGGFAVGQPLPAGYDVYNLPHQYRDTWYDTNDDYYRYGDDAIYRVDAKSGIIESIVALLAGDLNVGQQLPAGYDVYNVPTPYRDRYYDNDDYMYRYADGNIYQIDAKTQIIQAIIEALV